MAKLKLDDKGNVVLQDGKPVYVMDDGKEVAYDAPAMHSKIVALNAENKTHREGREAAEGKLKAFEGITDPAAAVKAMETVKNLDDKKLVDAGEVEKIKAAAVRASEEKIAALSKSHAEELGKKDKELTDLRTTYNGEKIAGAFKGSKFVSEKLAIPADFAQSHFGQRFKVEDGQLVGYDAAGNKLFSRSKPGETADFEEAIEQLVSAYPQKESILKGSGQSGGGGKPAPKGEPGKSGGGNWGGDRAERRAAIRARFGNQLSQ